MSETTFVVATNSAEASAALCDYLDGRIGAGDAVHVVNSLRGGDATDSEDIRDGEDALETVSARLGAVATVETHQFVRGNEPVEDVLELVEEVDADELVFGVRKRNPTAKIVFGSVAQSLLLNANVPMAVVPLEAV
jgi:nucleotide-binding universal stress UspA family protein